MPTFRFDPKSPILLVSAEIFGPKGSHFVRMLLDTGASYTMLHPDALIKIGCEPISLHKRKITTASGIEWVSFVNIPEICALGQAVKDVEISAHDLPPSLPAEGLLGLNFLRNFDLQINFREGKIELTAPK